MRVGLLSDSHGLADPKLKELLVGASFILHAGDIVKPEVLAPLEELAPVRAVRGNNDRDPFFKRLPEYLVLELAGATVLVIHDLGPRPRLSECTRGLLERHRPDIVVHGHSHRPYASKDGGRLFVNPGSCGPRRFSLPRTAALLFVAGRRVRVEFFDLSQGELVRFGTPLEAQLKRNCQDLRARAKEPD